MLHHFFVCFLATFVSLIAATPSYDVDKALSALYYCKAAYCPIDVLETWNCTSCGTYHPNFQLMNIYTNASIDSQAYVGYNPEDDQIVAAFRGSANVLNWIADLSAGVTPYKEGTCINCNVHWGFWQYYITVNDFLLNDIVILLGRHPTASVLVTGHSLGAAVATLFIVDLNLNLTAGSPSTGTSIFTFGSPRVGNPAFVSFATTHIQGNIQFRVVHRDDPVPKVPSSDSGFLHVPHEIWYDNDNDTTYTACSDSDTAEDPQCSDSISFLDGVQNVEDHTFYLGTCTKCAICDSKSTFWTTGKIIGVAVGAFAAVIGLGALSRLCKRKQPTEPSPTKEVP